MFYKKVKTKKLSYAAASTDALSTAFLYFGCLWFAFFLHSEPTPLLSLDLLIGLALLGIVSKFAFIFSESNCFFSSNDESYFTKFAFWTNFWVFWVFIFILISIINPLPQVCVLFLVISFACSFLEAFFSIRFIFKLKKAIGEVNSVKESGVSFQGLSESLTDKLDASKKYVAKSVFLIFIPRLISALMLLFTYIKLTDIIQVPTEFIIFAIFAMVYTSWLSMQSSTIKKAILEKRSYNLK